MSVYMTTTEVAERFRRDKRTLYRWMKKRNFPKPVIVSGGADSLFRSDQVEAWEQGILKTQGWKLQSTPSDNDDSLECQDS